MPNWCYTNIVFHGERKEIEDFHDKVDKWTSKKLRENGFGDSWLGNILVGAGLGDRINNPLDNIRLRCRGSVSYVGPVEDDFEEDIIFKVDTETAWAPMCAMWEEVIRKLGYKTIGFSYCAEEPGLEVYEVCDPYGDFPERYYIDIFVEGEDLNNEALMDLYDNRYFETEEDIVDALQGLLKTDNKDFAALTKDAEAYPFKDENTYLYIHKFDVVDCPTE